MKLTKLFLYLLILSLPLGQFGKIPLFEGLANIYLHDLLVVSLILVWLGYTLAIRKKLVFPPFSHLIFLFAAISFLSLLNGKRWIEVGEWVVAAMYWLRWVLYSGVYFVVSGVRRQLSAISCQTSDIKLQTSNLLIFSGLLLAIAGLVQLAIFPDLGALPVELGWDPHKNRLVSTFFDPNFTGAYLVLSLCLILPRLQGFLWVTSALLFGALILTFSRSAWLMFATSIGVIGILKSRKLLILALVVAFSAYFFVPRVQTRIAGGVDPDDSARFRFVSWKNTLTIAKDYLLTGVGFNAFRYAQAEYGFFDLDHPLGGHAGAGSDSSALLVLATTGIFGLGAYLLLYGSIVFHALYLNSPLADQTSNLPLALLAGLVGLGIESNFVNSLFYPQILLWLWIVIGLVAGVENAKSQ